MFQKHFTPQEATQTLPLVRKIVSDLLEKGRTLRGLEEANPDEETSSKVQKLKEEMIELTKELEALGCYYKDWNFEYGLVDFPAIINGQEALLCWRSDEEDIQFYHGIDEGYAGRKTIPESHFVG